MKLIITVEDTEYTQEEVVENKDSVNVFKPQENTVDYLMRKIKELEKQLNQRMKDIDLTLEKIIEELRSLSKEKENE